MSGLGAHCRNCDNGFDAIAINPWHFLSCRKRHGGWSEVVLRHDAVVAALWTSVVAVGGQGIREPKGLVSDSLKRPDLQIVFPGHLILTDVVITHPLTRYYCNKGPAARGSVAVAISKEARKTSHYKQTTEQQEATFIPFSAESCGGLGPQALRLLKLISAMGREHLSIWSPYDIAKHMLGSIAVAMQKGNARLLAPRHLQEGDGMCGGD
jgi:hypothetical protein